MIYSKQLSQFIPVRVTAKHYDNISAIPKMTQYNFFDGHKQVGYVHLSDLANGCYVDFVENLEPKLYKGVAAFADQLEVEHCLERGLKHFEIVSCAALNSHAIHYLRGKRFAPVLDFPGIKRLMEKFGTVDVEKIVKTIIENTPKGQEYDTKAIGNVRMYMPKDMIEHYIELSQKSPILPNVTLEYLA